VVDPEHKLPLYDILRLAIPFAVFDYFVVCLVSVDEVGTVDHGPLQALPRNQHEGNLVSKIGDFPKILEPLKLDHPFSFMARIEGTTFASVLSAWNLFSTTFVEPISTNRVQPRGSAEFDVRRLTKRNPPKRSRRLSGF